MSVTEIASATGAWSLTLRSDTPQEILDQLDYYGHVAVLPGRVDPAEYGDTLLTAARFVGVNRERSFGVENKKIGGPGMAFWLGDEEDKGSVIEPDAIVFDNATFTSVVNTLLPDSVQAGTIAALPGLYDGTHQYVTRRKALDYVMSLYNAEWRVRGDGKLDAGLVSDLYVTDPKTAILRNRSGLELDYRAMFGKAGLDSDVKDFTTRVLMMAQSTEASVVTSTADIDPGLNPYLDLFGNPLEMTRIIQENATSEGNAAQRAQLQLNRFTSPRDAMKLSTAQFDIRGDVETGDYVWVYDPEARLQDTDNEIVFHGETIWPVKLRVFQLTWPVTPAMSVAFRTNAGVWVDLTEWFVPEQGETTIVVGGYNRSLTGVGSGSGDSPGSLPTDNTSVPDVVEWVEPFAQATYQSDADGLTRAQVVLAWTQPLNTDSTVIQDGLAYEIQWRTGATRVFPVTHADMASYTHDELVGTFASPIAYTEGEWQSTQVSWDLNQFLLQDLTPGIPYEFRIRAMDIALPPNTSEWSAVASVQTRPDTVAPSTPAPAQSIAGSRNALQIVHMLGRASGGTFNLESDLNHLKIYADLDPSFTVNDDNLLGKLIANQGMLRGQIPVVGTLPLDNNPDTPRWIKIVAVDNFGNESSPSDPMQQTAVLIDSAFISELTVSKVTAGTIFATWIQAAEMTTALAGARVRFGWFGLEAYNINNLRTFYVNSATGDVEIVGSFYTQDPNNPGDSIRIEPSNSSYPTIFFNSSGGTNGPAYVNAIPAVGGTSLGLNSGADSLTAPSNQTTLLLTPGGGYLQYNAYLPVPNVVNGGRMGVDDTGSFLQYYNVDDLICHVAVEDDTVTFYIDTGAGLETSFKVRNPAASAGPFVEAARYCSPGEGAFAGQLYSASGTFSIGNGGGGGDPALFADGYAGRFIKNFVIDHPEDASRYLVHACTEGPTAGVEYSGIFTLEEDYQGWVELPSYFEAATLAENRQVFLTIQLPTDGALYPYLPRAVAGPVKDGKFFISSDGFKGTRIAWLVKAVRSDVEQFPVEPLKSEYDRAGSGPYTWLEKK